MTTAKLKELTAPNKDPFMKDTPTGAVRKVPDAEWASGISGEAVLMLTAGGDNTADYFTLISMSYRKIDGRHTAA